MDDLISRQAAIDAAVQIIKEWHGLEEDDADAIKYKFMGLPSAQQWIPVTDRLPEDLQEVNITWVNHRPEPYYEYINNKPFNGSAVYFKGKWYWYSQYCVDTLNEYGYCEYDEMDDAIEVTAWMPLPKPYRGDDHDEG